MARIEVSTGRGFVLAGVAYGKATMSSLGNRRRIGPKSATPKSYREVGGFVCPEFAHGWQSGCVKVYVDQNNWDGNIMHLRGACHIPFGKRLTYEQDGKTFIGVEGWL